MQLKLTKRTVDGILAFECSGRIVFGDESALFAADLARMYLRYAERKRWKTEILSESASDLGGYKELAKYTTLGGTLFVFALPAPATQTAAVGR